MPKGGTKVFSIRMTGAGDLVTRLNRVTQEMRLGQLQAATDIGREGEDVLKDAAPVFRGNLRDAIKHAVLKGGSDMEVVFYVDDILRYPTQATNPTPPSTYIDWVLYGRGPVEPNDDDGFLIYSAVPENTDWIYSKFSRGAEGNNFVEESINGMDGELEDAARAWAYRVTRVWPSAKAAGY